MKVAFLFSEVRFYFVWNILSPLKNFVHCTVHSLNKWKYVTVLKVKAKGISDGLSAIALDEGRYIMD